MLDFELDEQWIEALWSKIETKLYKSTRTIQDKIAYIVQDKKYLERPNDISWWTNGFYSGILWKLYYLTKDEYYRETAEKIENKLDDALFNIKNKQNNGFIWQLSSVANYKITNNQVSKMRGVTAASLFAARFNSELGLIAYSNDENNMVIWENMLNISLLYWASEETHDERFATVARMHADNCMSLFIRDDGSVNPSTILNPSIGQREGFLVEHGVSEMSSWSRGQAWVMYGYVVSYLHTRKQKYLDISKRIAHYFISNLAVNDDYLPDCDFRQPVSSKVKDSSAGAIAASALIEIARNVPFNEKKLYYKAAVKIIKALEEQCAIWDESCEGLLGKAATSYYETEYHNVSLIYGDYYFVEAVLKLRNKDFFLW